MRTHSRRSSSPSSKGLTAERERELGTSILHVRTVLRGIINQYPQVLQSFWEKNAATALLKKGEIRQRVPKELPPYYETVLTVTGEISLYKFFEDHPKVALRHRKHIQKYRSILDKAINELVESNYTLIHYVYSKAIGKKRFGGEFAEYEGAGVEGLIHGARRFDVTRNIRFSTMAIPWIRKYLLLHTSDAYDNYHRFVASPIPDREQVSVATGEEDDDSVTGNSNHSEQVLSDVIGQLVEVQRIFDVLPLLFVARLRAEYLPTSLRQELQKKLPKLSYIIEKTRKILKINS
jgi:hypothetical protein